MVSWYMQLILPMLMALPSSRAQTYGSGDCPNYQTSEHFTVQKASEMVKSGILIPYLMAGSLGERLHSCQYLKLQDSGVFKYSYRDGIGLSQSISGNYDLRPTTYRSPGYLKLSLGSPGILGGDIFGETVLYPIYMSDNRMVFVSCVSMRFFHAEYAYLLMPPGYGEPAAVEAIRHELLDRGVPLAERMTTNDQSCFRSDDVAMAILRQPLRRDSPSPAVPARPRVDVNIAEIFKNV